ncbi:MAG: hypothetical protein M3Y39_06185 [Chloroflexota bacterium]|nr:hypothetical protein [Chloroflexota bacterium]
MAYLFRTLYRTFFVNGVPLHQVLVGIALVPFGLIISWFALNGDGYYYYPYIAVFGVAFAILGVILAIKGGRVLFARKPPIQTAASFEQRQAGQPYPQPQPSMQQSSVQD